MGHLLPTHAEDIAKESVGRPGEVDARNRHTCMRRINSDDSLIELEITILVISEGRPRRTDIGPGDRPAEGCLRMQAPLAVAPVETFVTDCLRASVDKINGTAAHGRRRAVTGRGDD